MKLSGNFALKRVLALLVAVILAMPQFAFAAETTAPFWQFTDMTSHWAKKHVSKIALLGFASGMGDGTYAPNATITREQAVIMAVRMAGLDNNASDGTDVHFPFIVSDYAKKYVNLAFDNGIINIQEELSDAGAGAGGLPVWGTLNAKREWIAKLIVRAVGKDAEARAAMMESTGFVDEYLISEGYRGYIKVAKNLGIVSGTPEGTFKPADTVTRAEMAVFLGNAEKHLTRRSENLAAGEVIHFNGASISIVNEFGSTLTFSVSPDAGIYEQNNNSPVPVSRIGGGDYVNVIHFGNVAYFVEKTDEPAGMEVIEGTVSSLSAASRLIVLDIDGEVRAFTAAENVVVSTEAGSGLSFSSITEGSTVQLKRKAGDPAAEVTHIIVKAIPVYRTVEGTIESIGLGTRVVEIRDGQTGAKEAFVIPAGLPIAREGQPDGELADLHVGDEVVVELKDNVVTAMTVTKSSITYVDGKISDVNAKSNLIYLIPVGATRPVGYFAANNIEVEISGLSGAGLADLLPDDQVTLHLDKNEIAVKVVVKNRAIEAKLGMEFFSHNNGWVILMDRSGRPETYRLTDETELTSNGSPIARSNLGSYFTQGKKVDITYTGERLLSMALTNQYDGVITEINTNTRTIKINSPLYGNITLTYNNVPNVEIFGNNSATINQLRPGDEVQALLDANQERVVHLKLVQTKLFKVVGKQSSRLLVSVDDLPTDGTSSGKTYDLYVYNTTPIAHYANRSVSVSDIPVGGYIQATFAGLTATSVYIPEVSVGRVSSVNTAASALTVSRYGSDGSRTISNITGVRVTDGEAVYELLDTVRANDRVAAVEGKDGQVWIIKLQPQNKTFQSYNASQKTVEFSKRLLTDNSTFALADNAYLHRSGQTLTISSFVRNDAVTVYMWDGKIVEMEKK